MAVGSEDPTCSAGSKNSPNNSELHGKATSLRPEKERAIAIGKHFVVRCGLIKRVDADADYLGSSGPQYSIIFAVAMNWMAQSTAYSMLWFV